MGILLGSWPVLATCAASFCSSPLAYKHRQTKSTTATTSTIDTRRSMVQIEQKLADLGIALPPPPKQAANYRPVQRSGDLLYLSGHLPLNEDGTLHTTGTIGDGTKTVQDGYQAARQVGLNLLATMQNELDGNLDQVEQVVKLFGIVQSHDSFHEQHLVINGCSDLFMEVFGPEKGCHARSAIGTNALPLDTCVEIEAIVRVKNV